MEQNVVKSAARVLHILEFFDEVKRTTSAAEVAEHYGWPHSSTSVLMRSLVKLGYLHYDASERSYFPSTRVALLGDWIQENLFKDGQLMDLMRSLNDETGETVVLAAHSSAKWTRPQSASLRARITRVSTRNRRSTCRRCSNRPPQTGRMAMPCR